ncbi:MAG TPA: hypothetical protein PKA27_03585 [Fimbriimonadaceae bacterium]|nr:hypothetical protein [Fimbriimonadaceae bacterium]
MRLLVFCLAVLPAFASAMTIAQAKAQPIGTLVTIDNVRLVSDVDLVNSSTYRDCTVDDATGGMTIFGTNAEVDAVLSGVTVGDRFTITGRTDYFNGKFSLLTPYTRSGFQNLNLAVHPIPVRVADMQDGSWLAEALESRLVRLGPATFVSPVNFIGLTNYEVTDGSQVATCRIATVFLEMVNDPMPTGPVYLYGILNQFDQVNPFDGGYQLLPRYRRDIRRIASLNSVIVDNGELFDGDLNSVLSDDGSTLTLFNDPTTLQASVVFAAFIGADLPVGMSMIGKTSVQRPGIAEQHQFKNWSGNQWVTAGGRVATLNDEFWECPRVTGAQWRRNDGRIEGRILWQPINDEDPSQDGWLHSVDQMHLLYDL